jgi:rhamnose utilization protein RhaD (predicted bifunctional aldolase and dehydrogenase)
MRLHLNELAIKHPLCEYSHLLGKQKHLVQGAGGNTSYKEDGTLWVKASGAKLVDANKNNIFVALDHQKALDACRNNKEDFTASMLTNNGLRPSIETSLHAIMPQRYVVHLHPYDVIAQSVHADAKTQLQDLLSQFNWQWFDYVKPGAKLAQTVLLCIEQLEKTPDILVLANHGLVVAGDSLTQVDKLLTQVLASLVITPRKPKIKKDVEIDLQEDFILPDNKFLHALGADPECLQIAKQHWALYPDHVVFLGAHTPLEASEESAFVIIPSQGIILHKNISETQKDMLECYVEVSLRIKTTDNIVSLLPEQIAKLLDWDAEKYRQTLAS